MSKDLKPYRSEAERTALRQRNIQIGLSVLIVLMNLAILARSFEVL